MRKYLKVTLLGAIIALSGCSDDRVVNIEKFEKCMELATRVQTTAYLSTILDNCEDIAKETKRR